LDLLNPRPLELASGQWCGLEFEFANGGMVLAGETSSGTPFRFSMAPEGILYSHAFEAQGALVWVLELELGWSAQTLDEAAEASLEPLDFGVQSPESIELESRLPASVRVRADAIEHTHARSAADACIFSEG
jgi:hypothetical protein